MISSKKLVLLSAIVAALALPGCGKKECKKPKSTITRSDKRIKHTKRSPKKSKKTRSQKRAERRAKKASKSKKATKSKKGTTSRKSLLGRSY